MYEQALLKRSTWKEVKNGILIKLVKTEQDTERAMRCTYGHGIFYFFRVRRERREERRKEGGGRREEEGGLTHMIVFRAMGGESFEVEKIYAVCNKNLVASFNITLKKLIERKQMV
jgi:hypothetical protein